MGSFSDLELRLSKKNDLLELSDEPTFYLLPPRARARVINTVAQNDGKFLGLSIDDQEAIRQWIRDLNAPPARKHDVKTAPSQGPSPGTQP